MPAHRITRGPRYTKPSINAVDIRDGSVHVHDLVAMMREASVADRLNLGTIAHSPMPSTLRDLSYVCDQTDLTAYAGMPLFMHFCHQLGLADWLAGLPIVMERSDVSYTPGKKAEVIILGFVAGLERVAHFDDVKDDPGLCAAVGLDRLPDQSTFSRFFGAATAATVDFMEMRNRRFVATALGSIEHQPRLIVDLDTRDMTVYGKQAGSNRSPRKDGERIYTFEVVTVRNSRDMLLGDLMEGATHPAPRFRERFETMLAQLAPHTDELLTCGDGAYEADYVLRRIEAADADKQVPCRCTYAVRVQLRPRLKQKIAALPEEAWKRYDEVHEVAEVWHRFAQTRDEDGKRVNDDHPCRRYVATRKRLKDADGDQQTLIDEPRYSYNAIVTNLDWKASKIVRVYNQRATVESVLKESALGFNMDSLPSGNFDGNRLFCQLLVLAYNLVNLFRRLCLPGESKRGHVPGMRRRLLAVPGRVADIGGGGVVQCSASGSHVPLLDAALGALKRWFGPVSTRPALAGAG